LAPGTYCVHGTDKDTHGDTGTWTFCLYVYKTTHVLSQTAPFTAAVSATSETHFGDTLEVLTPTGPVTYTVTGGTTFAFTVFSTGFVVTAAPLTPGTYTVFGTDKDTHGDTGTWSFTLHVTP
jgi:hypothetical protein